MMWSAMNWLSQKAGINLDDAHEVLHGSDTSYIQADSEDEGTESSKENQSVTSNGAANVATVNGKRMRRSGRWAPPVSISSSSNSPPHLGGSSSSHLYHNGVSSHSLSTGAAMHSPLPGSPLTPIVVPSGVSSGPYCMGSTGSPASAHPTVAPIMVPTGVRTPGVGYRGASVAGLMSPNLGAVGGSSKLSPTSMQWKDVSMAADINSPGFSFRIVRQAEKQADLGSRMYPTAQEKYLLTKHLPKVRLHGPSKPVMTPKKPKSVPLIQLPSSPKPPSSLAPILTNAPHSPVSTSALFSPTSAPITDFRHADFFSTSIRSSAESHPVLSGLLDGTGSPVDHHSSNTSRVLDASSADVTSLSNSSITSMAVTAAISRSSSVYNDTQPPKEDDCAEDDPTSLKAVLAALNKSRPGKGVKRARLVDCDDPDSKRPCSDEAAVLPDVSCNGASSTYAAGGGGEKRALDTSSCSSLDNSQGSPCAKVPRTAADRPDEPLYQASYTADSCAAASVNLSPRQAAVGVGLGGGQQQGQDDEGSETPSKRRRVNPWLASFSSSRKMASREKEASQNETDLEALDTDADGSDKSSDDSDNSSCPEEEGETKPSSSRASPAPATDSATSTSKEPSDSGGVRDEPHAVTPHIVTLAAHRSDKNMSHTRLNKMLGMLFHLSEEEVQSSAAEKSTHASTSSVPVSAPGDGSLFISSTSTSLTTTAGETATVLAAPQISGLSGMFSAGSTPSISLAPALSSAPSFAPATSSLSAAAFTSAASFSTDGLLSSSAPTTSASADLARSATLPAAASSSESGSSVSASFTFKIPPKVQSNEKTASDSSSSAVVDGANPLLSFLAKNVSSSATSTESTTVSTANAQLSESSTTNATASVAPTFTFGSSGNKDLSGISNPLLTSFTANSSSEPKKSEGFSLLTASSTFAPTSSSSSVASAPQKSAPSAVSVAPPDFSFGSGASSASQVLFSGANSTTAKPFSSSAIAASTEAPNNTTSSLFSFGPSSSTATPVSSASGGSVAVSSTGSSPAKPNGFQFGFGAASTGFVGSKPQTTSSASSGGFTFTGSSPSRTNIPVVSAPSQTIDPNAASSSGGSLFNFGAPASVSGKNNDSSEGAASMASAAPSLLTFGSGAATTTVAAGTTAPMTSISTPAFTFGNSGASFSTPSAPAPTTSVSAATSTNTATSASFTFGSAGSNEQTNNSSTSASFSFAAKDNSSALAAGSSSPFSFGSAASSTVVPSSTSSSSDSPFTFGKSATVTSESASASKPSTTSLFSFGASSTLTTSASAFGTAVPVAGVGFGAGTPSSTAGATLQFGSTASTAPVFGSISANPAASSTDKPAAGGFGGLGTASNLFSGIKSSAPSDTGKNTSGEKSKTVTFGSPSVAPGGSTSLFGQTTPASSNPTNLFGQAPSSSSAGLFNKTASTTPSFGSSAFGQPAATTGDKAAAPSTAAAPFQFGNSSNVNSGNAAFTFGGNKSSSTFGAASGSAVQFGSGSVATTSAFGAPAAANITPSFGSITSNPTPSFGSSASKPPPSFGSATSNAPPSFGSVASNPPSFGSAVSNATPSFGSSSSNATPSFGSSSTLPSFGSATGSTPSFGAAAPSVPSFGSPAPSFGAPAASQPGMFQFSNSAAVTPQQQPNAFSAGHYALGSPMGAGQESHNLFSVGGGGTNSASRRPRVRAHRRNR